MYACTVLLNPMHIISIYDSPVLSLDCLDSGATQLTVMCNQAAAGNGEWCRLGDSDLPGLVSAAESAGSGKTGKGILSSFIAKQIKKKNHDSTASTWAVRMPLSFDLYRAVRKEVNCGG